MASCRQRGSPLAKGDPVGISGLDPRILAFSTPENAPTEIPPWVEKEAKKNKCHKNHPKKKVRALPFLLAR